MVCAFVDATARDRDPMPLTVEGPDDRSVGRFREDRSHPAALNCWVAGDPLQKGAATNAVQLGELLRSS